MDSHVIVVANQRLCAHPIYWHSSQYNISMSWSFSNWWHYQFLMFNNTRKHIFKTLILFLKNHILAYTYVWTTGSDIFLLILFLSFRNCIHFEEDAVSNRVPVGMMSNFCTPQALTHSFTSAYTAVAACHNKIFFSVRAPFAMATR